MSGRHFIRDAVIVLIVVAIFIAGFTTLTRAQQGTPPPAENGVQVVPVPTPCFSSKPFLLLMKEQGMKIVMSKNDDSSFFAMFMNEQQVVITRTIKGITCVLARVEGADTDLVFKSPEL